MEKRRNITDSIASSSTVDSLDIECLTTKSSSLLPNIIDILTSSINKTKRKKRYSQILSSQSQMIYTSMTIPSITILSYLERIISLASIEDSILISACIYLDRLCRLNIALVDNNIHKLLLTAIVIAVKCHYDKHYSNKSYAKIGGISLKEMNMLEQEFLNLLKFDLYISLELYSKYEAFLKKVIQD